MVPIQGQFDFEKIDFFFQKIHTLDRDQFIDNILIWSNSTDVSAQVKHTISNIKTQHRVVEREKMEHFFIQHTNLNKLKTWRKREMM